MVSLFSITFTNHFLLIVITFVTKIDLSCKWILWKHFNTGASLRSHNLRNFKKVRHQRQRQRYKSEPWFVKWKTKNQRILLHVQYLFWWNLLAWSEVLMTTRAKSEHLVFHSRSLYCENRFFQRLALQVLETGFLFKKAHPHPQLENC